MNLSQKECVEETIQAHSFCFRDRTDIVIKYMYAAMKLKRAPDFLDGVDVEKLYRQHIHIRTGGQEPGDEIRKGSLKDFEDQFDELIKSFDSKGFIKGNEVPLSNQNDLPINGAHRIATALALGYKIPVVRSSFPGGLWNLSWFLSS